MNTKKYEAAKYTVAIELPASPQYVFNHVVDIANWWPEEFVGERLRLNSEFVLRTGDTHYSKNKVVAFVPDKKMAWLTLESLRKSDNYHWTGTHFIFELTPKGEHTLLQFTYDGIGWEGEYDRLVQICDMTIREMLYDFIMKDKGK